LGGARGGAALAEPAAMPPLKLWFAILGVAASACDAGDAAAPPPAPPPAAHITGHVIAPAPIPGDTPALTPPADPATHRPATTTTSVDGARAPRTWSP
jgi:hypothetical protein